MKKILFVSCLIAASLCATAQDNLGLLAYQLRALSAVQVQPQAAVTVQQPKVAQGKRQEIKRTLEGIMQGGIKLPVAGKPAPQPKAAAVRPPPPTRAAPAKKPAERKAAMQDIVIGNITIPAVGKVQRVYVSPEEAEALGKEALRHTNEYRATRNLPALQWHPAIAAAAEVHSVDMATHVVPWSHQGFEERTAKFLKNSQNYSTAENLYKAQNYSKEALPKMAVEGWIKSPGHHVNLIGDFTYCGIGVCKNSLNEWYYTQIFGTF